MCIIFDQMVYKISKLIYIHNKKSTIELLLVSGSIRYFISLVVIASFGRSLSVQHYEPKPFLVCTYCVTIFTIVRKEIKFEDRIQISNRNKRHSVYSWSLNSQQLKITMRRQRKE